MYPLFKQEATKKAGQLSSVLIVVYELLLYCKIVNFCGDPNFHGYH